jgi:hypothetical protein
MVASRYLAITRLSNPVFALAGGVVAVLRAVPDGPRPMYVILARAIVTAGSDPLFIFGFGLGVYGGALRDGAATPRSGLRRPLRSALRPEADRPLAPDALSAICRR